MPLLERPKTDVKEMDSKALGDYLKAMAKRLNIDLSQADNEETASILKDVSPLSDEVAKMRNSE